MWGKQKTPGGISPGVFCFPRITLKSKCTNFENCFNQVINEISENASSRELENLNLFSQPLVQTVIGRTRALVEGLILSITAWTRGCENLYLIFQLPEKDTFSDYSCAWILLYEKESSSDEGQNQSYNKYSRESRRSFRSSRHATKTKEIEFFMIALNISHS